MNKTAVQPSFRQHNLSSTTAVIKLCCRKQGKTVAEP